MLNVQSLRSRLREMDERQLAEVERMVRGARTSKLQQRAAAAATDAEAEAGPENRPSPSPAGARPLRALRGARVVVVPDSNVFLWDLRRLRGLKRRRDSMAALPGVVIAELEGLQQAEAQEVAFRAREALRFLQKELVAKDPWVRTVSGEAFASAPASAEDIPLSLSGGSPPRKGTCCCGCNPRCSKGAPFTRRHASRAADLEVLSFAMSLRRELPEGVRVVIATGDKGLQVRARMEGVEALGIQALSKEILPPSTRS